MLKLHEDKILNKLYNKVGTLYESGKLEEAMLVLDKVYDRRVKLGEIDASEEW